MADTADPRRRIPRVDELLALPESQRAVRSLGETVVKGLVRATQDRARRGEIAPDAVTDTLIETLASTRATSLTPVLNATGVIVHTNLGRAPLSQAAVDALVAAAGYVDVELDLATGTRSRRGAATRAALLREVPQAEDALVVNNAAAALMLTTTALAGTAPTGGKEVVISRGEFIEIGAGFRLADLIASTGARIREVGTTNRTHLRDYADAIGDDTGAVLHIHPSNYRVEGFTSAPALDELADLCRERGVPLIADLGSGLLRHDDTLPEEPDAASALAAGADLVLFSGDKLLGGPQAGVILGRADLLATIGRHPLARAVRADKLTLAALEATLGGETPVQAALHAEPQQLRERTERLAERVGGEVVPHDGRVGGGGGVGVPLPGWALALPESLAAPLRTGTPAVLPRIHNGQCLIDLRCIPPERDAELASAIEAAR